MLLTQLPSLLFTLLAAWLFTVNAQDTAQSETKSDVKSIPVRLPSHTFSIYAIRYSR